MSTLATALADYLALRRSLGYKLERPEQLLADFVACLDSEGTTHISVDAALAWATRSSKASDGWRATQLGMVRCFARYAQALDPAHEVPPTWLLPSGRRRPAPYIYSEDEITRLMAAARRLGSPLRATTLEAIIGLLAVSGLRVGEILRLDRGDLQAEPDALAVRNSKEGKSRMVPLSPSTVGALEAYLDRRDECCPSPTTTAMFISTAGTRLRSGNLRAAFEEVRERAGLAGSDRHARLADMRHSFAVRTLIRWHEEGIDVQAALPALSAYLGHVSPASTYWYFSACPQLLGAAARRLAAVAGGAQ